MKKNNLKQLAMLIAKENIISKKTSDFILTLSRKNIKIFLHFYKNELQKKQAYITTASRLSMESLGTLKGLLKGKKLILNIDTAVGAGIKVQQADIITDYTFKRYIDDTIELLK